MKYKQIFLLFLLIVSLQGQTKKQYFRIGVVKDSLKLDKVSLYKGDKVQIILKKCTEEGSFIKTKLDSGKVYYNEIWTVCWVKKTNTLNPLGNIKSSITITPNDDLLFIDIKKGTIEFEFNNMRFKVKKDLLIFDNRQKYNSILK